LYSIYIWQQLFCTQPEVFGLGKVWWMSFPGWLVPALTVAFISYYGFERPFLRLRTRFRDT
jgi:peptidoglycan/LPS O-acetylase OafA/YrhL